MDYVKDFIKNYGQFFIGIGIIVVSVFMYCIASEQTDISRNIAKITESATRPYIVIESAQLREFDIIEKIVKFTIGEKFSVAYTIKNKGQTPAYEVREMKFLQVLPPKSCLVFPEDTTLFSNPFIVGTEITKAKFSKDTLSQSQYVEFGSDSSQTRIFFWGRIKYQDSSKRTYFTNFGYEYVFLHGIFSPYKDYNSAN